MDVVYILGNAIKYQNVELRYSLRSLVNLPHQRVFFVGGKPDWIRGIHHIPTEQRGTKWENARKNIRAIADSPDISDKFILMNDDFFILRPVEKPALYNRGPLETKLNEKRPLNTYWQRGENTLKALKEYGVAIPLCFETHTPVVMEKRRLRIYFAQDLIKDDQFLRSMYFNLTEEKSLFRIDCKYGDLINPPKDYFSTTDVLGRSPQFSAWIHRRFPEVCYYESNEKVFV